MFNDETCRGPAVDVTMTVSPTMINHEKATVTERQNESSQSTFYANSDNRDFVVVQAADVGTFNCFDFLTINVARNDTGNRLSSVSRRLLLFTESVHLEIQKQNVIFSVAGTQSVVQRTVCTVNKGGGGIFSKVCGEGDRVRLSMRVPLCILHASYKQLSGPFLSFLLSILANLTAFSCWVWVALRVH
jgi:hypothetical protein